MKRRAIALGAAFSVALAGCGSTPKHAEFKVVPPGSQIQVDVKIQGVLPPDAKDTGEAMRWAATQRAMAGTKVGVDAAIEVSALCGPLIIVCLPFAATTAGVLGAVGGSVVGGMIGGVEGAVIGLPADKAKTLEQLVHDYVISERISDNLLAQFNQQQQGSWQIVAGDAQAVVTLGVEGLRFNQYPGDELQLVIISNVMVNYDPGAAPQTKRILVTGRSAKHHIDHWIADEGANLRAGLEEVFAKNTRQVIGVLGAGIDKR